MKKLPSLLATLTNLAVALSVYMAIVPTANAQDGSNLNQVQEAVEEINNGTNPTLLTTQMGMQY